MRTHISTAQTEPHFNTEPVCPWERCWFSGDRQMDHPITCQFRAAHFQFCEMNHFCTSTGLCLSFFTRWNHTPLSCNERLDSFGVLVLKFLNTKYLHDFLTGVQLKAAFLLAKICGSCTPPQDNNMEGGVGAHNRALVQGCVPVFTSVNGLCLCL